jgi:hypothetical protein
VTPRDARIVVRSRLYRLLADRREYMRRDLTGRAEAVSRLQAPHLSLVDAEAIEDMTEIDRLCGAAVRALRQRYSASVADLLEWLDPDRLAAVALALPEDRRRAILRQRPEWGRALQAVDTGALGEVETLIGDFDALDRQITETMRALGLDPEEFADAANRALLGLPSAS